MKRFKNYIAKHHEGIYMSAIFFLIPVAEADTKPWCIGMLLALITASIGLWGKRISNERKNGESL